MLDVGTGTGAIALAIADEHPGARVTGLDRSRRGARPRARERRRDRRSRSSSSQGDATKALPPGPWDLVVSNPPYVLAGRAAAAGARLRAARRARRRRPDGGDRAARARRPRRPARARGARDGARRKQLICFARSGTRRLGSARIWRTGREWWRGRWEHVEDAVAAIRAGKPVILPTDTVYGLGADALPLRPGPASLPPEGQGRDRRRSHCSPPTSTCCSSACPSFAAAAAGSPARCCPGRTRSCCRTRHGATAG